MDNPTRQKMMDANPHQFSFKWKRGPRRAMCENQSCNKREIFDPSCWSRALAIDGPPLLCTICEKIGIAKHESTFCSKRLVSYLIIQLIKLQVVLNKKSNLTYIFLIFDLFSMQLVVLNYIGKITPIFDIRLSPRRIEIVKKMMTSS
jgi:hypothetical protein